VRRQTPDRPEREERDPARDQQAREPVSSDELDRRVAQSGVGKRRDQRREEPALDPFEDERDEDRDE
jgi:hypothetical protein